MIEDSNMKQCSYTWWECDKEKEKPVKKQCPEEIWTGSKEYCIFHDPSEKKDTKLFGQKLKEKLNKKDYNFKGYWFLEEADFKEWKFQKDLPMF